MDDAAVLIKDLQNKLAELDRKVLLYRQDLSYEFNRYTEEVLKDVPAEVADVVLKALSTSGYDNVRGASNGAIDSPDLGTNDVTGI